LKRSTMSGWGWPVGVGGWALPRERSFWNVASTYTLRRGAVGGQSLGVEGGALCGRFAETAHDVCFGAGGLGLSHSESRAGSCAFPADLQFASG
jgi:hypothetical protein